MDGTGTGIDCVETAPPARRPCVEVVEALAPTLLPFPTLSDLYAPRLRRGRRARQSLNSYGRIVLNLYIVLCMANEHAAKYLPTTTTAPTSTTYILCIQPHSPLSSLHLLSSPCCAFRLQFCVSADRLSLPESGRVGSLASYLTSYTLIPPPRCLRISQLQA
jgi:hypothetical protein